MPKYPLLTDKCNFEPRAEAFSHIFTVEIAWGWQTDPSLLVHPLQALCRLLLFRRFLKICIYPRYGSLFCTECFSQLPTVVWLGRAKGACSLANDSEGAGRTQPCQVCSSQPKDQVTSLIPGVL